MMECNMRHAELVTNQGDIFAFSPVHFCLIRKPDGELWLYSNHDHAGLNPVVLSSQYTYDLAFNEI